MDETLEDTEETAKTEGAENTEETAEQSGETEKEQEASGAEEEKKGLFGKKKNKKDKKDEQIEELTDKLKRQMAEFDNFRKRTEKEKEARFEIGAKSVIEKILPTVDNFERGLATVAEEQKEDPFVVGMEKVYKQLMASLEALEVVPIDAVGKEFDPNMHNAVLHIEDEAYGENIVAEELLKGYTYKGNVVRHSMVKVAN
ncbi:MAG: nucleotide exchange factor GrpE [Robinsoniella sp.]|nr:nucleotide exchange factor GrpE [Robinsoniella sp.]